MRARAVPAVVRRNALPLLFGAFAIYAGIYAAVTTLEPHRIWAICAFFGYALATLVKSIPPAKAWISSTLSHFRSLWVSIVLALGALVVPLGWLVMTGVSNPEIPILRDAGVRWLHSGTPFPGLAELAAHAGQVNSYNVYLPGLALFGMPSAVFGDGPLTDPRIWLLAFSVMVFVLLGKGFRILWFLTCPFVALELVTGATDIPVLGLICLGLVFAGRDRSLLAGLCIGFAVGMKAFAWPAVVVVLLLVLARRTGFRELARCAAMIVLVAGVLLVPVILADPQAFAVNALELPLGGLDVQLTAGSPLPGHLLATHGATWIALGLLGIAALALGVAMLCRPPRDAASAGRWLAVGITLAVLLAPSSRYGYLVYPVGLFLLPWLAGGQLPVSGRSTSIFPDIEADTGTGSGLG